VEYPSQKIMQYVESGDIPDLSGVGTELIGGSMNPLTNDVKRILENCNDTLYAAIYDLVTAADEATFLAKQAEVLKDIEDANITEAWEFASTEFDRAFELTNPILQEYLASRK
ncbi:MAG: hypothetical protein GX633_02175, partial [Clostridiales bacterium]|nr:hypothetical protein [Clostridiales bacterium]